MNYPNSFIEDKLRSRGKIPAGIDEAGRGPLAGPVVAAAVILPKNFELVGINDSKKLNNTKRLILYNKLIEELDCYAIGIIEPQEIDKINILRASLKAMKIAVNNLEKSPDYLLVDGNHRIPMPIPQEPIIKGDGKCTSIAAASIIAKVTRDRIMENYHNEYPQYNFTKHKGYPTKEHIEALKKFGACPIHRRSYRRVLNIT